ncbi:MULTISPECIES: segregation/condensation protein A [Enterococcus]|uniref:segregation/condensation protein A n=1 Tax=Enterococcus TaxID=1350 RepID=UPI0010F83250|nr:MULTISPECIES: segregation/condensation protein A [Enterococcus]KAF1304220.1 segregation/condensation protein A [Enterococcus sp. JM9B]
MREIKIKLAVFEGPLDLLLHLIQKLELDIYDIPIADVTEQYMEYIHTMKTLELEVAGEYLVMAASLMAIKSQMLLPKQELEPIDDAYEEDPREALVAQLLEYRKYKYAAEQLSEKAEERSQYYTKEPMDIEDYRETTEELPEHQLNTIDLFLAFHQMLEKRKKRKVLETTISADENTIEEKIKELQEKMRQFTGKRGRSFESFFVSYSKSEIVATFLALLELMKKGQIRAEQEKNYGEIMLYATGEEYNEIE